METPTQPSTRPSRTWLCGAAALSALVVHAVALPTADADPPLGWTELPNTQLDAVCLGGPGTCANVVNAWNSAVFDTMRNRLIIWGGGHSDYGNNEIYALNLDDPANVERITDSTSDGCSMESCDGGLTPNSRHTYDGIEYMPNIDRMFVYGGSRGGDGFALDGTWTFDFANEKWQLMNPAGDKPLPSYGVRTAYDPNTGKVFLDDNSAVYAYDFATNSYTKLGSEGVATDYHLTGVIDPVRKKFISIGAGQASIVDISGAGSYDAVALTTTGGDAIVGSGYPGLVYDPVSDRIVAWNGGDSVYSLDLDTNTWTKNDYAGGPGDPVPAGTYGRWNYAPALGAFVLLNSTTQNAFLFRLSTELPDAGTGSTSAGSGSGGAGATGSPGATSTSGAVVGAGGASVLPATSTNDEDSGCGCRVSDGEARFPVALSLGLAAVVLRGRRRRARRLRTVG